MEVRLVKMGFEDRYGRKQQLVVVTTLLDQKTHKGIDLAELYVRRWEIEVRFRDIKGTLDMGEMRVRSPEMAIRTLQIVTLAYSLLRLLMLRAGDVPGRVNLSLSEVAD